MLHGSFVKLSCAVGLLTCGCASRSSWTLNASDKRKKAGKAQELLRVFMSASKEELLSTVGHGRRQTGQG